MSPACFCLAHLFGDGAVQLAPTRDRRGFAPPSLNLKETPHDAPDTTTLALESDSTDPTARAPTARTPPRHAGDAGAARRPQLLAIFTPTSFTDSFDLSAPPNQPISLRDAIIDANNDTGTTTDTIVLQVGHLQR